MGSEQTRPHERTIHWLSNRIIPVPHGEYSAEALLTMIFTSRDLPGDRGSLINEKCEELRQWVNDISASMTRDAMNRIIDEIQALTDSKLNIETRSDDIPPPPGAELKIESTLPEWSDEEPPTGMAPGVLIMACTIAWLRGNEARLKGAIDSLTTGKPNKSGGTTLKKSPRDFISYCLKQNADIVVDWVFNAMKEDGVLKVSEIYPALKDGKAQTFLDTLREWGLENDEGVVKGSKAAKRAAEENDIKEKLKSIKVRTSTEAQQHQIKETAAPAGRPKNPVRDIIEDGQKIMNERDKVAGSAAAVFKGTMEAYKYLHKNNQLERMAEHIQKADDPAKAIKPLLKLFDKFDNKVAKNGIAEIIVSKKVPVNVLSDAFGENKWQPLYDELVKFMTTIGPQPPPQLLEEGVKV